MKRIFAAVMTVVLSICCVFSAFAESAGYMIGDARQLYSETGTRRI